MAWYYLFKTNIHLDKKTEAQEVTNTDNNIETWTKDEKVVPQIINKDIVMPKKYQIWITHAWWEWIRSRETVVRSDDWDNRYLNEPDYPKNERAPSFMNNWGYLIRVSCKDWYNISNCRADSTTATSFDDNHSCWITIDKMKITWMIECTRL
jgi:hypothetical protein